MKITIGDKLINKKMIDVVKMPSRFDNNILINRGKEKLILENVDLAIRDFIHNGFQDFYYSEKMKYYINLENLYMIETREDYMILTFSSGLGLSIMEIDEKLINEWMEK
jgi:hypothetical protein